jgi:hypothetical protein
MVTVINPRGQLPPIRRIPMAPRLNSLDGKTIYVVDIRWSYTRQLAEQIAAVLSERFPKTKFVVKDKAGSYGEDDQKLWAEIKENGHGMIMSVGH